MELDLMEENLELLAKITTKCDKIDYMLSVSSGLICGIIDIFLVDTPKKSKINKYTDIWFENRVKDFSKFCGWNSTNDDNVSQAIRFLERKYKVVYDQRGAGDSGREVFNLTPTNHHFKSLGHNPSILGLFFSILDQFSNTSTFVSNADTIILQDAGDSLNLKGDNIVGKIFSGIVNWLGHLMSDVSGSSTSINRGMGIPSPLWTWSNDVIAIKNKLGITSSEFDKSFNNLALKIYSEGYDLRFQITQAIPVLINELVTRLFYSTRRMLKYYSNTQPHNRDLDIMWNECKPFSNFTVKRMLTVAHGTFCLLDVSDIIIRDLIIKKDGVEFFMRLNIIGVGRFTFSLFGEMKMVLENRDRKNKYNIYKEDKKILCDYLEGLNKIAEKYNDENLMIFFKDFTNSDVYLEAFLASTKLAEKRNVTKDKILYTKEDGERYFKGE